MLSQVNNLLLSTPHVMHKTDRGVSLMPKDDVQISQRVKQMQMNIFVILLQLLGHLITWRQFPMLIRHKIQRYRAQKLLLALCHTERNFSPTSTCRADALYWPSNHRTMAQIYQETSSYWGFNSFAARHIVFPCCLSVLKVSELTNVKCLPGTVRLHTLCAVCLFWPHQAIFTRLNLSVKQCTFILCCDAPSVHWRRFFLLFIIHVLPAFPEFSIVD